MSTKKRFIQEMAELGLTHARAREIIEEISGEIESTLAGGESVKIQNFGKFEVRDHDGRKMVNPSTGEEHEVEPRKVVHFSPSQNFVARVNESEE